MARAKNTGASMRFHALTILIAGLLVSLAWPGDRSSAAALSEVGSVDTFLGSGPQQGNPTNEINFMEGLTGLDLQFLKKDDFNPFTQVDGAATGVLSAPIPVETTHFLVKTGKTTGDGVNDFRSFVYANVGSKAFAVIDIGAVGIDEIGKISHLTLATPIPGAALLLGSALVGLGAVRRFRSSTA